MRRHVVGVADRFSWVPFVAILLGYVVQQVQLHHADFGRWDFLMLSGWATLAVGLALAQTIPRRLHRMLHRLRDRGSMDATDERLAELTAILSRRGHVWGLAGATVVAVGVVVAFLAAGRADLGDRLLWLEVFGGLVAGYQLGRAASYGSLGSVLKSESCAVQVTPGHFDGAAGLKPVGDYYFFQAMVAGIPAAFLAVWWLVIPLVPRDYEGWRNPYLGLLVLAIAVELLCFFVPVLYFHREMERQKEEYQREADKLSSEMADLDGALASAVDPDVVKATKARVAEAKERYELIDGMPTWPMDSGTRRRLRVRNLALLLPVAAKIVGTSGPWKEIADALSRIGS
ncbi:MAG: hypothetical protein ACR2KK_18830 [Acidimicrobiales bacterium]